jgi:hypothetical protein
LTVTVELVVPVARLRWFVTVTVQATACPPTLSVPLHWFTAAPPAAKAASFDAPHVMTRARTTTSAATSVAPTAERERRRAANAKSGEL